MPDETTAFIAEYLAWARKRRVFATFLPIISYRGHGKADWLLLPTLCRQPLSANMLKQFEEEIIREYRDRFSLAGWDDIEVLAYARHHGAPTRLLDWSRNPLIGLWFAVADKANDASDGTVFQLNLLEKTPDVCPYFRHLTLEHADNCQANRYVHVFLSPRRAGRTERQQSVFSIASFKNDYVLCPLDQTGASLSKFSVPAARKAELRYMLADLGLDAYSVYGDVDSFGEYVSLHFDVLNRPRRDKPADEIR